MKTTTKVSEIKELTPEQQKLLPQYLERFEKIGLSTDPTDQPKAESAITRAYNYLAAKGVQGFTANPEFIWAQSPMEGARVAAQHAKGDLNVTDKEVQEQAGLASYGSLEAYWVSVYTFISEQLLPEPDELAQIALGIVREAGVFWTFEDLVVCTPKPTAIHMKEGKLHSVDGMALSYPDGKGIYAFNGERKKSLIDVVLAGRAAADTTKAG